MELKRARELLGNKAENMTDEQVQDLLTRMDLLSNLVFDFMEEQIKKHRREGETANECLKRLNKMWKNNSKK